LIYIPNPASNDTKELFSPLLSRFIVSPHMHEQFVEITIQRLSREEGISRDLAINIAEEVLQKFF
jgi:hypothetical protein